VNEQQQQQVDREVEALLAATGIERDRLRVREVDWSVYLQAGVLVKLSIHTCISASATTLEDLGIRPQSEEEKKAIERTQVVGGYVSLIPVDRMKALSSLKGKGRTNLEKFRFDLEWGDFVPQRAYASFAEENERLRAAYLRAADKLVEDWEDLKRQTQDDLFIRGGANYDRLRAAGVAIADGRTEYANAFVKRKLARLQRPEIARKKFTWDTSLEYLPLGTSLEAGLKQMLESNDPMLRDLARSAERKVAGGLDDLAKGLVGQIRGLVYNVTLDCLTAMKEAKGELPRNSTSQIKRMFDAVDRLQFWPDAELEDRLKALKDLVETAPDYRDDGEVQMVLRKLGTEMRTYLLEIDSELVERSGAEFGIPDRLLDLGDAAQRGTGELDLSLAGAIAGAADGGRESSEILTV